MNSENPYAAPISTPQTQDELLVLGQGQRRMRFWRIDRLKADLRDRPLCDRESLPYLLFYAGLFTAASAIPHSEPNVFDQVGAALSILIAVLGTVFVYQQNGGRQGHYFLQRYFAIGFVVAIRCATAIIFAMSGLLALEDQLGILTDETSALEFLFETGAEIVLYWRIGHHVGDLAKGEE